MPICLYSAHFHKIYQLPLMRCRSGPVSISKLCILSPARVASKPFSAVTLATLLCSPLASSVWAEQLRRTLTWLPGTKKKKAGTCSLCPSPAFRHCFFNPHVFHPLLSCMENIPAARCFFFSTFFLKLFLQIVNTFLPSPFILSSSGVSVCSSSSCLIFLETNYRVLHEQQEKKLLNKRGSSFGNVRPASFLVPHFSHRISCCP